MRHFLLIAFCAVLLAAAQVRAEVIEFVGKATSIDRYEVWSAHASQQEQDTYKAMDEEIKNKQGSEAVAPGKPFSGRMVIMRVLVDVGSHVSAEQPLLTYAYPLEDLHTERRKLSQSDITSMESTLVRTNADLALAQTELAELRSRLTRGTSSQEEIRAKTKDIEVMRLKQRALQDSINLEKETSKGELELARAKFGPKASSAGLPIEAKLLSQETGYVLWVNPDLRPGVSIDKKTKLLILGNIDPLVIRALVHEIQLPRLRLGDKASVVFEALPGETFTASITRIQQTANATETQLPSHFEVQLTLPNPGLKLKDGLRGTVRVQVPDGPRE